MLLALDTETTGVPLWSYPDPTSPCQVRAWPRLVSVAWQVVTKTGSVSPEEWIAKPEGFKIPKQASDIHGITQEKALKIGKPLVWVLDTLHNLIRKSKGTVVVAAYNCEFDFGVLVAECTRLQHPLGSQLLKVEWQCVMKLVKQVGNHRKHLNLKTALQTYVPSFNPGKYHTASGDVTALVALMLALARFEKKVKHG